MSPYIAISATLFLITAVLHLFRVILGWHVDVSGLSVPFWASYLVIVVALALAYWGFTHKR